MSEPAPALAPSDAELLHAVRSGDPAAYGQLYARHVAAAQGLAHQLVRGPADADDVVSEAFARVLDLLRRGGGPADGFRPYLLTAVRRVAYDRYRGERRQVATGAIEEFDPGQPFVDRAVEGLERSLIARAFLSLPERWRAVLWHTEIEGAKPADVAPLLGLTANGVAALSYRAREGLRQAYLQMHLSVVARHECRPTLAKLGAYVRGGLSRRDADSVRAHLETCEDCRAVYAELTDVNSSLRGMVAPIFLGPAAAAYLAAVKGGAGWLAGPVRWFRRTANEQQAVGVVGLAAAVALAVGLSVLFTVQNGSHARHPHAAAAPPRSAGPPGQPGSPSAPRQQPPSSHPGPRSRVVPGQSAAGQGAQATAQPMPNGSPPGTPPHGGQPAPPGGGGGSGGGGTPPPVVPPSPGVPPPPAPVPAPSPAQLSITAAASTQAVCAGLGVRVSGSRGGGLTVGTAVVLASDLLQGLGSCPPPSASVSVSARR